MHFRERPWDLFLSEGYVVVVSAFLLGTGQGIAAAILLVVLVPGYLLIAALYPADKEIGWLVRLFLSFVLSLAVVPLLALALNFSPFGISLVPLVVTVLAFSLGIGWVAYRRRMRLPIQRRLSATLELRVPAWGTYSGLEKVLAVSLAMTLVSTGSILSYVLSNPRPGDRFTEFYLLGVSGTAEGYPTNLNTSETGTVLVTVTNHEFARIDYAIRIEMAAVTIVWNESTRLNETVESSRTTLAWYNLTLDHGGNWSRPFSFQIPESGLWQVDLFLFRDGDFNVLYRNLHLFVTVAGS